MKKLLRSMYLAIAIGLPGIASATPIISVDPTESTGLIGDTISINILWDGLADMEYLSVWDIDLSFDDSILAFIDGDFDPEFGLDSISCDLCFLSEASPGVLDIYAESLDDEATLVLNQDALGNQFIMMTLRFEAIANGTSPISFSGPFLTFGDEAGAPLTVQLVDGRVCIGPDGCTVQDVPDVPEPAAAALMIAGLALLRLKRFRKS